VLDLLMRLALARLELLSYGKTMSLSWSTSPTCEVAGGRCPGGAFQFGEVSPHDYFATLYGACKTDSERLIVLCDCQDAYVILTTRKEVVICEETAEEWQARVLALHGWPPKDVALSLRCSATEVRRIRTENDCDPETGKPVILDAKVLRDRGCSWREIARMLGCSAGAIRYQLRNQVEN
jgi:hypothetical protein